MDFKRNRIMVQNRPQQHVNISADNKNYENLKNGKKNSTKKICHYGLVGNREHGGPWFNSMYRQINKKFE